MKQYRRGIEAYKSSQTGTLVKDTPIQTPAEKSSVNQDFKGLIKTSAPTEKKDNKFQKVAKLLLVLGKDEAAKVISHLPENEIEKISLEISKIDRVGKSEALELLKEFGRVTSTLDRNQGGVETARSILVNAFGQDRGNQILYKALPDSADKPFAFLNDLDFKQRMLILRKESVSVLTIVLHYLSPKYASPILEALPPDQQRELVKRLAKLNHISPHVISIISEKLTQKIKLLGNSEDMDIDGRAALADILKHMDRSSEQSILSGIKKSDPFLGEIIKDKLYTIDIILSIDPIDLQKVIQEIPDRDLVYLIKGESREIQEKIWNSMSEGRKSLVEYEMESVGLVKKSEADKMTRTFIELIQKKEEEGSIRLLNDDDLIY